MGVPHARGRKNSWNFYKQEHPEIGLNEPKNVIRERSDLENR